MTSRSSTPTDGNKTFSYDEIMNVAFKMVNAADYYAFDPTYNVWTDKVPAPIS